MDGRQLWLWRQYAFDVIPLEFISSIYEAFVSKKAEASVFHVKQKLLESEKVFWF